MDLLHLTAPAGTAWELFIAVAVIILGPLLMERARIPGLIGLLLGGLLIGPNVLGIAPADGGIIAELGEVGLLYLMFIAGLELDLNVFARYRRQAVVFTIMTFGFPLLFGILVGLGVGYEVDAAVLIGSLLASHTLVSYPIVRRLGLATNAAVATAVGATCMTDTMALIVLAVISGKTVGSASGPELVVQVVLGLVLLLAFCFIVLPRLAHWYFATVGQQRLLRYTFIFASLLACATVASVVGIEPIVGAFFAGLGLNRQVPNEGELMERIEFFGSALVIPIFLVSVGTVIDPSVLVDLGTLGLALGFVAACLGGKAVAAVLTRPAFGFSWDEVGVVFSLTVAQAAATLAATFIGLQIGLLDTTAVNAVMVLIAVSLLASSTTAAFFGQRIPRPPIDTKRLGRSVLVHLGDLERIGPAMGFASRVASPDGGVVRPLVVVGSGEAVPAAEKLEAIEHAIGALGVDAEADVRHDRSDTDGVLNAAASFGSSLIVTAVPPDTPLPAVGGRSAELVGAAHAPVAFVASGSDLTDRVVLVLAPAQARRPRSATRLAVELVARVHRSGLPALVVAEGDIEPGLLTPLGEVPVEDASGTDWAEHQARANDIVVVPGGRNGAAAGARTARHAIGRGSTVVVVADAESIGVVNEAAEGLGVVTA